MNSDYAPGQIFHIAGNQELTNIELADHIIDAYNRILENKKTHYTEKVNYASSSDIEFIPDHDIRPGHDRRYALDCSKLKSLGWAPQVWLNDGIYDTVSWYINNSWWQN